MVPFLAVGFRVQGFGVLMLQTYGNYNLFRDQEYCILGQLSRNFNSYIQKPAL